MVSQAQSVDAPHRAGARMTPIRFGRENPKNGGACCNKPVGCSMTHEGCLFLSHPWKRAHVLGDSAVRCQARSKLPSGDELQCDQGHGHPPPHTPVVVGHNPGNA